MGHLLGSELGDIDLCCVRRLAPSAGLDPFQCVVNSLQCEVSLINWPFQLQPVFLYKPRPRLCIQLAPACCSPPRPCQPRLLAASEGSSEDVFRSRNVSSAFLQCSCFLGFSQRAAEQPVSSPPRCAACLGCALERCKARFVGKESAEWGRQLGRWC